MTEIELEFTLRNPTKGTYRYQEVAEEGFEKVGGLYIKKATIGEKAPERIKVKISWES